MSSIQCSHFLFFSIVSLSVTCYLSGFQVYREMIFSGRYSESHCSMFFFSRHCQEAGILFMSNSVFGLFQPRCADYMTFYCLPTENKLYIHLDGLPSIFLVAYEFRNVIWAAVSISRMYIFPSSFHHRLKQLLSSIHIHDYSAVHGEIFMKPVRMEGERENRR